MKSLFSFFLILLFSANITFAQNPTTERLLDKLKQNTKEDTLRVIILDSLAYFFSSQDTIEALNFCRQSLELAQKIEYTRGIAKAYQQLGRTYYMNSEFKKCEQYYTLAIKFYEELQDKNGMARNMINLGMVKYYQGNKPLALEQYLNGLKIYEELKNQQEIARVYGYLGTIYYYQSKYTEALEYYNKNMERYKQLLENKSLIQEQKVDYQQKIATTLLNIGNCYSEMYAKDTLKVNKDKYFQLTLDSYNKSLEISVSIGDDQAIAFVNANLGDAYTKIDPSKAIGYYNESLELAKQIDDIQLIAMISQGMGTAYSKLRQDNKAIFFLKQSLKIGKELELPETERAATSELHIIYARNNFFKEAYEFYRTYHITDSILNGNANIEAITKMGEQYRYEQEKAQKDLEYQEKLKRERLLRYVYITGLFIAVVFGLFVYRSYKRKQRDNILLEQQKKEIEEAKKSITDSILYARRIQTAILPSPEMATELLKDYFILFRPRDIVSGDFFWMTHMGNRVVVTAADCTGHGVPGAFMSMLGVSFLNAIVNKSGITDAHEILNNLRELVKRTLDQTGKKEEAKDGMDIAMCTIDFESRKLQFAGAYNSLYYFRNREFNEIKADRMPIGIYIKEKESFTLNELDMLPGDVYYIFSDGYPSQFGGEKGGKLKSSGFKEILERIQDKPMPEQRDLLDKAIDDWRGELEQVDDVLVIGFRV